MRIILNLHASNLLNLSEPGPRLFPVLFSAPYFDVLVENAEPRMDLHVLSTGIFFSLPWTAALVDVLE